MLLAVACSLREPQPVYRAGANREASDLLSQMRLAQTEHGSFVVALWTPVVSPPIPELFPEHGETDAEQPAERRLTRRLADALEATRRATESVVEGLSGAFARTIQEGVSANLCEAVAKLITPFPTLDVSITWARTRPTASAREEFRFAKADAPILLEAARLFRLREPKPMCDCSVSSDGSAATRPSPMVLSLSARRLRATKCPSLLRSSSPTTRELSKPTEIKHPWRFKAISNAPVNDGGC